MVAVLVDEQSQLLEASCIRSVAASVNPLRRHTCIKLGRNIYLLIDARASMTRIINARIKSCSTYPQLRPDIRSMHA